MPTGTEGSDTLEGTSGDDTINGLGGNDTILLSQGHDFVDGGSGTFDRLIANTSNSAVFTLATGARTYYVGATTVTDSSGTLDTTFTGIERVRISTTNNGDFSDTLDGSGFTGIYGVEFYTGGGNDTLVGSAYNDFFGPGLGSNVVFGGAGFDSVQISYNGLGGSLLTVTQTGGTVTFSEPADGTDTIYSSESFSVYSAFGRALNVDASAASIGLTVTMTSLADTVIGSAGADVFTSLGDSAVVTGDVVTGGNGADTFRFLRFTTGFSGTTITDFGAEDRIDLQSIQYNDGLVPTFLGQSAFTGVAGQYRYEKSGGQTFIQADVNGDGAADRTLTIANGEFNLTQVGSNVLAISAIYGSNNGEALYGTSGNDIIYAYGGSDTVYGSDGTDYIDGGTHSTMPDHLRFDFTRAELSLPSQDVTYTLTNNSLSDDLGIVNSSFSGIERFSLNLLSDFNITFDATAFTLSPAPYLYHMFYFGSGDDSFFGGASNDFVGIGTGSNVVNGGGGQDYAWVQLNENGGGIAYVEGGVARSTVTQGEQTLLISTDVEVLYVGDYTATFSQHINAEAASLPVFFMDGVGNDFFVGGSAGDTFFTNSPSIGSDTLRGNGGADTYDFIGTAGALDGTIITDFATDDVIDLRYNDYGDQRVTSFIGRSDFSGVAGQYRYYVSSGSTFVQLDFDGDTVADGTLEISNGQFSLAASGDGVGGGNHLLRISGTIIYGTSGDDVLSGTAASDEMSGLAGNDILNGGAGNDTLAGDADNDTLDGGTGADTMTGGSGNDVYYVDDAGDVVSENAGAGTDEVRTALATYTLGGNVENLTGTSASAQTLTGNGLANVVTGNAGNDTLNGLAGADTLVGGLGNDIYVVDNAGDVVSENAGEGTDEVRTSLASYTLGANLEKVFGLVATGQALTGNDVANVLYGLAGNDTLVGGAGNDKLYAGAGNDVLDGGIGADEMTGGTGNDVYYVDSADVVTELAGEGTDEVRTTRAGYVLGDNVENLTGLVATGQSLAGNGLANVITGGAGNDQLDGKAGADTLVGGAGNDTYYIDDAGDVVSEMGGGGTDTVRTTLASYQIGTNVENLVGTGTGGQTLLGNNAANAITGTGSADTINGAGGDDTMTGGNGNDIYYVGQAGDVVVELAGQGYDIVRSTISYVLPGNVESLRILGVVGLTGTGNALDNQLIGNAGGDTLWGLAGVDRLYGIGGSDTLWGGTGDDFLFGGDGADTLHGEDGADFLRGDNDDDVLHGGAGGDNMAGGNGNDTLHGGADNDYMFGDAGNDTLWGGTGLDTLWGGLNTDTFAFADGDSSADAALCDRIIDFAQAQGDRLDLSAMDASTLAGGDQAFAFIGTSAFAGTGAASAGELRYTFVGAYTFVQGDTDGNGTADFMIRLDGNIAFNGVDVIL